VTYRQITRDERYTISLCRAQGMKVREIADFIGRPRSTIYRELARNRSRDGCYRYTKAQEMTNGRRCRSRQVRRIGPAELAVVEHFIREDFSPEQVSGYLSKECILSISHETIYRHIWEDKRCGGDLYRHLRGSRKKRLKRYGRNDSRGRLAGKRKIDERPPEAENRVRVGDWEADTVMGSGDQHCVLTLVERKTGYVAIGKLEKRTTEALNKRAVSLIRAQERAVHTVTADNGTEFHGYKSIEKATGVAFYFATPHHAWERGTNENTNGLIRQYLPKGKSMAQVGQRDCNRIAAKLNNRPRKRLGFRTPRECYETA
jgi:IS30 family transposase